MKGLAGTIIESTPDKTTGSRLLIGEDDPVARQILGLMLRRAHYEVDLAENGQVVVEMWEKGGYDLVLMDVQMPWMDGLKAAGAIREKESPHGGHTPIVAMTGHSLKEDRDRCVAAGMDAYLSKPIDFKKSLQVIQELLSQAKAQGGERRDAASGGESRYARGQLTG